MTARCSPHWVYFVSVVLAACNGTDLTALPASGGSVGTSGPGTGGQSQTSPTGNGGQSQVGGGGTNGNQVTGGTSSAVSSSVGGTWTSSSNSATGGATSNNGGAGIVATGGTRPGDGGSSSVVTGGTKSGSGGASSSVVTGGTRSESGGGNSSAVTGGTRSESGGSTSSVVTGGTKSGSGGSTNSVTTGGTTSTGGTSPGAGGATTSTGGARPTGGTSSTTSVATGGATNNAAIGGSHSGEATYYSPNGNGNCSFGTAVNGKDIAALNNPDYSLAAWCGACAEITGPKGKVTVLIQDRCPECKSGDLDLNVEAFTKIADQSAGRVKITWNFVSCKNSGPVSYHFKEGTSGGWTAVQVLNHNEPIAKLEYSKDGGATFIAVSRVEYNYFIAESGFGNAATQVRITSPTGKTLIDTLPVPSSNTTVQGKANF